MNPNIGKDGGGKSLLILTITALKRLKASDDKNFLKKFSFSVNMQGIFLLVYASYSKANILGQGFIKLRKLIFKIFFIQNFSVSLIILTTYKVSRQGKF